MAKLRFYWNVMRRQWMSFAWVGIAGTTTFGWAGLDYPGHPPGRFAVDLQPHQLTLSNQALAVHWDWTGNRLRRVWIKDRVTGQELKFRGEWFNWVLNDGQRYPASDLQLVEAPRVSPLRADARSARQAGRLPGKQVQARLQSADGRWRVHWRILAPEGANYVRQEVSLTPRLADSLIRETVWFDEAMNGARLVGSVDGSPLVVDNFFFSLEDPMAVNRVTPGNPAEPAPPANPGSDQSWVHCRLQRNALLRQGQSLTQSAVMGVVPPGQLRRGFLYYLERERAHPYRPFLHYNSWYDLSWPGQEMNATNCAEAIRLLGDHLVRPYRVKLHAVVLDDGWDDPRTLWQFHQGFPDGFKPLTKNARRYRTHLGVWLSPFGGYGASKDLRLRYGHQAGFETNATGFSLAGPRYYEAFRGACLDMIRQYGVNHFKFDGIASGMYANGPGENYLLDTEAMRQLMGELRGEDPTVYVNLTTGSWPSPFWLRYADSVWRQGDDMGFTGKGNPQQQWLTYRDREVYRNIVGKGPLYPLNALMTQGVAYSRHGSAGRREFDPAGFRDDVRAFFGAGTGLQELYIQPQRLRPEDWRVLAEAANWSCAHADVLVDTHWILGDPGRLEVYGYASWDGRKGILMLRNPDDQPRQASLDLQTAFELPPSAPRQFRLCRPWREDSALPPITASAGQPLAIALRPFEVLILEATPH